MLRRLTAMLLEDKALTWFDRVAQLNGTLCGAGGVLKIDDHTKYRWTLNCGSDTNSRAELMGAWATLTLATRLSVFDLFVLRDSKIVIDWLNGKGSIMVDNLYSWKERIYDLIPLFRTLSFAHIFREENKVADNLSKNAIFLRQGQISYSHWEDGQEGLTYFLNLY
jgi:ribonuclease HI